ncbi:hypothetical protein WIW50_02915 [Flavobacteriaceae bacterium 3-367]|uniref:hypothetical protein n=1 Tax=Eudoraea algarum TaxID=3417568 RepID=UPI003281AA11
MDRTNVLLILSLVIGVAFHGSAMFFTLEYTYDALIHLFFADHYAQSWFEPWDYRWYTGFTVQAYPPLVHQSIALLSFIGGLKFGLFVLAIMAILLFITGVYRFSLVFLGNRKIAGYASLLAVFSSTFLETLHLFGQLPSLIGLSVLLHALPEIYLWLTSGKYKYLLTSLSLIAVTVTSHHVTPIFGMVFFIFPLIGMALIDQAKERAGHLGKVTFRVFIASFRAMFWRVAGFGMSSLVLIVVCILPYWINTKKNPITQVPIPHGSRDNFLEVTSSGLVFFLIPWGILLVLLPYLFYRFYSKRYLFFGLSFSALTLLGTGGTTPLPRMLLGENAFNILTLDRFTLWATIMALPLFGELVYRLAEGDLKALIKKKTGGVYHKFLSGLLAAGVLFMVIFTMSLGYFRPAQPQKIKMLPIVNFLNQDQHDQWRYLTLGFGDQMAWLSAQTNTLTVDGNYHSARRLPELTTRAIERLENSKFKGIEGIGSLQQFLTVPEKYHLKYIFSNDKFYDPLLYFCGWQRLQQLENGIQVWEKLNVPPLPALLPKEDVAVSLKLLWGLVPICTLLIAFMLNIQSLWLRALKSKKRHPPIYMEYGIAYSSFPNKLLALNQLWAVGVLLCVALSLYQFYLNHHPQRAPENVLKAYYDAVDFKEFERAHTYLDPASEISLAQYMLEVSVSDGILSSHAKLDAIAVDILEQTANKARAQVRTEWVTPLEKIKKTFVHELNARDGRWYLRPLAFDNNLPSDQLFSDNTTSFFNQGRRRITTQETHHEDILQQPVLEVLSAKLVKFGSQYAIVGELQNVDHVPADVVIKASLYNNANVELANYNAKYHMKHKLMPKEITPFRINFEGVAWSKNGERIPGTFNPEEFTPIQLREAPTKFDLQCAGNVAQTDLYKRLALQEVSLNKGAMDGTLFNWGVQEVTIPQLLVSYYGKDRDLLWVDHQFLSEGVRVQRKQSFTYVPRDMSALKVISSGLENCFVNGLPNAEVGEKRFPEREQLHAMQQMQPYNGPGFSFLKFELNAYVGNPK